MAAQKVFHYYSVITCPKFSLMLLRGQSSITKRCAQMYCKKYFSTLNYHNLSSLSCSFHTSFNSQKTLDLDVETTMSSTQMTSAIRQEASTIDKMALSVSDETIARCIRFFEGIEMSPPNIRSLLTSHPEIFWVEGTNQDMVLTFLSAYGLSNNHLCKVFKKFPAILELSTEKLDLVIENLRQIGIYSQNLPQLISDYPEIFLLSSNAIQKRSKQLRYLFKTVDVVMLIRKSPGILCEDWDNIEKKFHYVFGTMGITQPQIRYSNLFSYSLEHIQTRHLWVERCGLFRKFKAKEEKRLNPRLSSIIDTSDQDFAKKFGDMTVQEYKTFCKLVRNQIDRTDELSDLEEDE